MRIEVVKNNISSIHFSYSDGKVDSWGSYCNFHIHDDIEILVCNRGIMKISFLNEDVFIKEGDLIVINRRVPHSTLVVEEFTGITMLQFRIEKLRNSEFENINKYLAFLILGDEREYIFLSSSEKRTEEIISVVNSIQREYQNRNENFSIFIEGYMNILIGMLYRYDILKNNEKNYNRQDIRKIWPAIEFIHSNYDKQLTLDEMSSAVHVNSEYFCRIFRKATGISPTEYVNYVRIWKAENLLISSRESILEISLEVGFSSVSYFNRVFKKLKNMSPSAFRKLFIE